MVARDIRLGCRSTSGTEDLSTTQRYMHVSPAAVENAIRLLDSPAPSLLGEHGETVTAVC